MRPEILAAALIRPRRWREPPATPPDLLAVGDHEVAIHLSGDRQAKRRALLVHGWEADARDMAIISQRLTTAGVFCVAPDLPAHGASSGKEMAIPDGAKALVAIVGAYGPFDLVVGHSMGAAITLYAVETGVRFSGLVLLAPPVNYVRELSKSARAAGAPEDAIGPALDVLRKRYEDLDRIDGPRFIKGLSIPGLVVAAGRDEVLDPAGGRVLAEAWGNCSLLERADVSHRGVLRDEETLEAIVHVVEALSSASFDLPRPDWEVPAAL